MKYVETLYLKSFYFLSKFSLHYLQLQSFLLQTYLEHVHVKILVPANASERLRVNFLKRPKKKYTVKI